MSGLLTEGPMPRLVVFDLDGTIWDPDPRDVDVDGKVSRAEALEASVVAWAED